MRRIPPLAAVPALLLLLSTPPPSAAQAPGEAGPRARSWPTGSAAEAAVPPAVFTAWTGPSETDGAGAPSGTAPSAARLAVGGVLGGTGGLFGLGLLGAWIADESAGSEEDLAAVGGFVLGGAVGEVLGMAAGVHVADGFRGSFWSDLGVSALVGAGSLVALAAVDADGAPAWTLAGVGAALQVGLTVRTELGTR